MSKRPSVPQALKYRVLLEAGFKCAFPNCEYPDVDIHHIRDWAKVQKHAYENLLALCPNHHRRAGQGKITINALELLKAKLQIQYGLAVTATNRSGRWSTCSIFVSDVPRYEISIDLPQLHAKSNVAIPEINAILYVRALGWVHDLRAQELFHDNPFDSAERFVLYLTEFDEETKTRIREEWLASKDGFIVGFEIWMPSKNLVSVRFNFYSCVQAAAHPNRWVETVNYQLGPAAPLQLWDLLREGRENLKFVCDFIASTIRKHRGVSEKDDYFYYPADDPNTGSLWSDVTAKKLSNFVLTDGHLVFLFSPYEIASYANKNWAVWIPYRLLQPYANPKGPISQLIKSKNKGARRSVKHF